jgi:hypothetical protein
MIRSHAVPRMLVALLLVSLGGAACSGASSTPAAGGTNLPSTTSAPPASGSVVDPCVLVTAAEAQAALGGPVDPTTSLFTGTYQACSYATASGQNLIVTTRTIDRAGFDAAVAQIPLPRPDPSPLAGLCQDAYIVGSNVWAWQNGTEVDARVIGTVNLLPAAKQVITIACGRL